MPLYKLAVALGLSLIMSSIQAVTVIPVPIEPIYYEPPVEAATDEISQQSCVQLDRAINYLHPYRYTYKAGFYEDDKNQLATTLIAADGVPLVGGLVGLAFLGYSSLIEEKEERRMLLVEQKIAMLQQVKAEKHCFE